MSLKKTKEQLVQLLGEADNSVIAVSGKWGTGKTHLWNEIKAETNDEQIRNSFYVSLFGLSTIDQVKRKLIEAAIPGSKSYGKAFDGLRNLLNAGVEAASKHYKALAAINNLNILLMAPVVLRDKLIVIDDIERKHDKLGINEVLGFIDEYSKQYGTRFILVLNDDQLSSENEQLKLWTTFREKIIDHEVKLTTTADEAFSIAIGLRASKYAYTIKRSSITCRLTNIRIVNRVIKVANQILADRDLEEPVLQRVIPSIVLFSAIYYHGLDDGPDFKFALNIGNPNWEKYLKDDTEEPTPEEKRADGWRMLMNELGINGCDEFEEQLVEFLESGLFEASNIEAIIDRYIAERDVMLARATTQDFLKRLIWDHRVDESTLEQEATELKKVAGLLSARTVTELDSMLAELPNGATIGAAIIDEWITAFRKRTSPKERDDNPFDNPLHPKIQEEFNSITEREQEKATVVDACIDIIENSGWGTLQEVTLKRSTIADFETAIRETENLDRLKSFMRQMIRMRINRASYDDHFGLATENFVQACRSITSDAASPRLAGLIKRLYKGTTIESELIPQSDIQA